MKAWKLLVAAVVTSVILGISPYLLHRAGWLAPIQKNGWIVLLVTWFGLVSKLYIADRAADGEFLFYKFGYDNCIVTFGAVLTALALQLQSSSDLYPGLSSFAPLNILSSNRNFQLFLMLIATLFASLFTAHIAGEIKRAKQPDRGFWSFLNSIVGSATLGIYVLILVTKG